MELSDDGFRELSRRCAALAPRLAAVLEGGYNLATLPRLVAAAHEGFSARTRNGRLSPTVLPLDLPLSPPRSEVDSLTAMIGENGARAHRPGNVNCIPRRRGSINSQRRATARLLERVAARRDPELAQHALDVRAHGVLGDEEPLRDVVRREMVVEQEQDLDLARGQRVGDAVRHATAAAEAAAGANLVEQSARDLAGECGLAVRDAAQERDDALRRLALEQVAGRAAADRGEQVLLRARGRQDDHLAVGSGRSQAR